MDTTPSHRSPSALLDPPFDTSNVRPVTPDMYDDEDDPCFLPGAWPDDDGAELERTPHGQEHEGHGTEALSNISRSFVLGEDLDSFNPLPPEDVDVLPESSIESIDIAQKFITAVQQATLDNGKLDPDATERLRNPPIGPVDISDPDTRFAIDLFLAMSKSSEATYAAIREAIQRRHPDNPIPSLDGIKSLVAELTGVVAVHDDMCINSCHAFTGPFQDLDTCSICGESRWDESQLRLGKRVPRQQMTTFPLGPQLQAIRRSEKSAEDRLYLKRKTDEVLGKFAELEDTGHLDDFVYDDVVCGSEFLDLAERVGLTEHDHVVAQSIDGAQLYQNKTSDMWIGIWILWDYDPSLRYKRKYTRPAFLIPGPTAPKITESYTFRSFHHLSALQKENNGRGFRAWDAKTRQVEFSRVLFTVEEADAPGLAASNGRVGHHGVRGCRLGCPMKGRRRPGGGGHYYAAHLCPHYCSLEDSRHPDHTFKNLDQLNREGAVATYDSDLRKLCSSQSVAEYEANRKETGLSKPSILSGLDQRLNFPVPKCFTLDHMHLWYNKAKLLFDLWRGTMKVTGTTDSKDSWNWMTFIGDAATQHGKLVAAATRHFPSSFHRPPRNPMEKWNSGYKTAETFLYIFGLGPGLFRTLLPPELYKNFCRLVKGAQIMVQRSITTSELRTASIFLTQYVEEFETLYYQRRMDRLHFCWPCNHTILHTPNETARLGPGAYTTQYTLEGVIGDLGSEVKQPSNPFANLGQRALRRCQVNALLAMCPELDSVEMKTLPRGAIPLENGYVLLGGKDRRPVQPPSNAIQDLLHSESFMTKIRRWARLRLPNGQIARSFYGEGRRPDEKVRRSRNIKFIGKDGLVHFGEVQFYFLAKDGRDEVDSDQDSDSSQSNDSVALAVVSVYSDPHPGLLFDSFGTLIACRYEGEHSLQVIDVAQIKSVVSMPSGNRAFVNLTK